MPALFHTDAVQEHIFPLPEEIRTLKVTKMNWPLEKDISLHLLKKKKKFFSSNIQTPTSTLQGKKYFHISFILPLQLRT